MVGICCNTSSLLRRPIFRGYVSFREGISGQIIATFSRRLVTPNDGSIGVFHPKYPNNSGLGIKFILPRYVSMLDVYNVYPASPSRPNYFFGRSKSFTWIIEKTKLAFVWFRWTCNSLMSYETWIGTWLLAQIGPVIIRTKVPGNGSKNEKLKWHKSRPLAVPKTMRFPTHTSDVGTGEIFGSTKSSRGKRNYVDNVVSREKIHTISSGGQSKRTSRIDGKTWQP